jgi:phosphoribosylamine--glycine ligase
MGSYSTVSEFDPAIHLYAERLYAFLKKKGINYIGFLYLGILIDKNGVPLVLEINTRPGEPEIQTILSIIDNDIANLFYATATNQPLEKILFNKKSAVSVRIVNKEIDNGNKNKSKKTDVFQFPAMSTSDIKINLSQYQGGIHSVLTTSADSINDASDKIYKYIESIDIKNYTYRSDIGYFK